MLPRALANFRVALETILNAGPQVKVVAITVPDIREMPMIRATVHDRGLPSALVDRYSVALGPIMPRFAPSPGANHASRWPTSIWRRKSLTDLVAIMR